MAASARRVEVAIPYRPRQQQARLHFDARRFNVLVAHRRFGKTVWAINHLVRKCLECSKQAPRYAYIAPFFVQAKDVAFEYLKRYTAPIPGMQPNESELRVDLPGDRRIRLYGADNADRLRGLYFDGVVLDEPAQMQSRVWSEIIRPALADREGWAVFIGTPMGRNSFFDLYDGALNGFLRDDGSRAAPDPTWRATMYRASETGIIPKGELDAAASAMTPAQYQQEFECSFEAAIVGAYYGALMAAAEKEKRITSVPWEPRAKVWTAWDLGAVNMAIWFAQQVGNEVRLIDFIGEGGKPLSWYAGEILERKARGWAFGEHLLPHDAEAPEMGTGKTRVEMLRELGITVRVLPNGGPGAVDDRINATSMLLPRCWFDINRCAEGIAALREYRSEWDDKRKIFKDSPLNDWASHACLTGDAMVDTASGPKRIDSIAESEMVWTPAGYAAVTASGPVKAATELVEIITAGGKRLICTPEHKIFTSRGLVTADALRYLDSLMTGEEPLCSQISLFSRGANIGFRTATIALSNGEAGRQAFIGPFGRIATDLSRPGTMFITGMKTARTAIRITWNAFRQATIAACTPWRAMSAGNWLPLPMSAAPAPLSGIDPVKDWRGTGSMGRNRGPSGNGMRWLAGNAGDRFERHSRREPNSVISIVKWQTSDGAAERPLVYDLTVAKHHCYRANGLLVSNSDALGYLAMGLKADSKPRPAPVRSSSSDAWMA